VVVVDFAHYADRSHTVDLPGSYHAVRADLGGSRGKVRLRALQDGLAPNPIGAALALMFSGLAFSMRAQNWAQ
jgi:hypothetical protein